MKSVLVIAHPDDESLFFGGLLLTQPGDWTIICCSVPRRDSIRSWKFFDACEAIGAKGRLIASVEPEPGEPLPLEIMELFDLDGYDRIATHGAEGEYGHRHHLSLHEHIHKCYADKEIWSCCPPDKSDYDDRISLGEELLQRKLSALKCYDHILPYEGLAMTKCEALIRRYCQNGPWDLSVEQYRIHRG